MVGEVQVGFGMVGRVPSELEEVLTPQAVEFVARLAREFEGERQRVLQHRASRREAIRAGRLPDFLPETQRVRQEAWTVAPAPPDLRNRRVEITGPTDRKMMINALNSGAQVFMADFEDANCPTWLNMLQGQLHLKEAVRRTLRYVAPDGREYRLGSSLATLAVRPRGWHLLERHFQVDGRPVAGALFDFGLFAFHNAARLLEQGSGPYFYLPKLEGHLEARLWNRVFAFTEQELKLPPASIRATVLIEHVLAAFEMDEILYELRERITGLNLGRWDYIFSFIKTFADDERYVLPDRRLLTVPATPFLRAAARLLVHTCHRRGAHAIGGMSAYIPRKDDPEANRRAFEQVRADKQWEAEQGFDGAWVAHPGLVEPVHEIFSRAFSGPHQIERIPELDASASELLAVPEGPATEEGLRTNVSVALQYLGAWLGGRGAVAIYHLMEDTATAEISRSQIWQWLRHRRSLIDGRTVEADLYRSVRQQELQKLAAVPQEEPVRLADAAQLLDELVLGDGFVEFLTIPGARYLQ